MTAGSVRFNAKVGKVIEALLLGATQDVAARHAGVSSRTVRRYLADPGVQRRLAEAQEEAIKTVRRSVTARARSAVLTLGQVASGTVTADATRVNAAKAILSAFVQLQPRQWQADIHTSDVPVIDYRFEGIDPEALR